MASFTETFPSTGSIESGQDQSWELRLNTITVEDLDGENRASSQTVSDYAFVICLTALATSDHKFGTIVLFRESTPDDNMLPMVAARWDETDDTFYAVGYWNNGGGGVIRIIKVVEGSMSVLAETAAGIGNPAQDVEYDVEIEVTTIAGKAVIKCRVEGVLEATYEDETDPILTGVRGGLVQFTNVPDRVTQRTFYGADVGGAAATVESSSDIRLLSQVIRRDTRMVVFN